MANGAASCSTSQGRSAWPTTRLLFLLAGTITLLTAVLASAFSPWFLVLTGLVGVNQLVFVVLGACPASVVIDRLRASSPVLR